MKNDVSIIASLQTFKQGTSFPLYQKAKKCIAMVLFCCLVLNIATYLSWLQRDYEEQEPYTRYINSQISSDVIWVGSSHIFCTLIPQRLFEYYGYSSSLMTTVGSLPATSYTLIAEAIAKNTPQIIALDLLGFCTPYTYDYSMNYAVAENTVGASADFYIRDTASMRLLPENNLRKYQTIFTLRDQLYTPQLCSYLLNAHTEYLNLDRMNFADASQSVRNLCFYYDTTTVNPENVMIRAYDQETLDSVTIHAENLEWYNKIIDLCKQNNIPLLAVGLPYFANEAELKVMEQLGEIAVEAGMKYLSMTEIKQNSSLSDESSYFDIGHLNYYGAQIMTDYMGEYLTQNYDLTDHRDDTTGLYDSFQNPKYHYTATHAAAQLEDCTDIVTYLDWLTQLDEGHLIIFATETDTTNVLNEEQLEMMKSLQFLSSNTSTGDAEHRTIIQTGSTQIINSWYTSSLTNIEGYKIEVIREDDDGRTAIFIEDTQVSLKKDGLKIVVYDLLDQTLIDSVVIQSSDQITR